VNESYLQQIQSISDALNRLRTTIINEKPCKLHASLKFDDLAKSVVLSANIEGMVFFASVLMYLASTRQPNQHEHFSEGVVLDESDLQLIIKYVRAEWDD